MLQHGNARNFNTVVAEVRRTRRIRDDFEFFCSYLGNENNFMTHDECEAMCEELIHDHKTSRFREN